MWIWHYWGEDKKIFYTEIYLTYNVVLVSGVQHSDSIFYTLPVHHNDKYSYFLSPWRVMTMLLTLFPPAIYIFYDWNFVIISFLHQFCPFPCSSTLWQPEICSLQQSLFLGLSMFCKWQDFLLFMVN